MALTESERTFMDAGRKAGYSDDELVAKVKERRTSNPGYKLTDYAGEAAKLPEQPPERLTADDSGENAFTRFMHRALPDSRMGPGGRPNYDDAVAHDPTAQAVLAGTLGAGAGSLVAPLGRIIAGGVNAGTQTAVTGGDLGDVGTSALIGAAIPAAGMAARGIGRRITNSGGGQARQLWEKHGGNVGPLDSGSGVPEIEGLDPTRTNVGKASAIGARNIRKGLEADFEANTERPYVSAKNAVDYSRASKELTDVSSLMDTISEVPQSLRGAVKSQLGDLGATVAPDGRVMMSNQALHEAKQRLQSIANYGLNTGPGTANIKDKSFKALANAAKVLVDEGPYAEANSIYEGGINMHEAERSAIGLKTKPSKLASGRAAEDAKVAQTIRNAGNDSEAAGAMAERADLANFKDRNPHLARQVDLPDLVRAKGNLEFGLNPDKLRNLNTKGENPTSLKKLVDLLGHNSDALKGRVLYQPGRALGAAGGAVADSDTLNQIIAAYQAQRQRDEQRAQALGR